MVKQTKKEVKMSELKILAAGLPLKVKQDIWRKALSLSSGGLESFGNVAAATEQLVKVAASLDMSSEPVVAKHKEAKSCSGSCSGSTNGGKSPHEVAQETANDILKSGSIEEALNSMSKNGYTPEQVKRCSDLLDKFKALGIYPIASFKSPFNSR